MEKVIPSLAFIPMAKMWMWWGAMLDQLGKDIMGQRDKKPRPPKISQSRAATPASAST